MSQNQNLDFEISAEESGKEDKTVLREEDEAYDLELRLVDTDKIETDLTTYNRRTGHLFLSEQTDERLVSQLDSIIQTLSEKKDCLEHFSRVEGTSYEIYATVKDEQSKEKTKYNNSLSLRLTLGSENPVAEEFDSFFRSVEESVED